MQYLSNACFKPTLLLVLITFLTACGGSGSSSEETSPSQPSNTAPVANAGMDITVTAGDSVTLDGSQSTDAEGDSLSFEWSIISAPSGSSASLTTTSGETTSITTDEPGEYVISLTVNDGSISSDTDTLVITATVASTPGNNAPVADAGENQTVVVGETVLLSGANSYDADNEMLTFQWQLAEVPIGSSTSLSSLNTEETSFKTDLAGEYRIELTVNDGIDNSAVDFVIITASNQNVDITNILFGNRSGDCGNYIGNYYANVTDIKRSGSFCRRT